MRIGLIDVDGHNFPNVALMKLSAWHKAQGDDVEWALPLFGEYDRIYASKVFTFTPDYNRLEYHAKEFIGGGYWLRYQVATARAYRAVYRPRLLAISAISVQRSVLLSRLHPPLPLLSGSRQRGLHPPRRAYAVESSRPVDRGVG